MIALLEGVNANSHGLLYLSACFPASI